MSVYIVDITATNTVLALENVKLNSSNPITYYSIYVQDANDENISQPASWGLVSNSGTLQSTGNIALVVTGYSRLTENNAIPDGLYANQLVGGTPFRNSLTIDGDITLTTANTYTGETTINWGGTLVLNNTGGNTFLLQTIQL